MPNGVIDLNDIYEKLGKIEGKVDSLPCGNHIRRIERVEASVGRQNFLASVFGALAGGAILALKYLFRGDGG